MRDRNCPAPVIREKSPGENNPTATQITTNNANRMGRKGRKKSSNRGTTSNHKAQTPTTTTPISSNQRQKKHKSKTPRGKQARSSANSSKSQVSPSKKSNTRTSQKPVISNKQATGKCFTFKSDQKELFSQLGKTRNYKQLIDLLEGLLPNYRQKCKFSVTPPAIPSMPEKISQKQWNAFDKHKTQFPKPDISPKNNSNPDQNDHRIPTKSGVTTKDPITPSSSSAPLSPPGEIPEVAEKNDSKREGEEEETVSYPSPTPPPPRNPPSHRDQTTAQAGQLAQMTPIPSIQPAPDSATPFNSDLTQKMQTKKLSDSAWKAATRPLPQAQNLTPHQQASFFPPASLSQIEDPQQQNQLNPQNQTFSSVIDYSSTVLSSPVPPYNWSPQVMYAPQQAQFNPSQNSVINNTNYNEPFLPVGNQWGFTQAHQQGYNGQPMYTYNPSRTMLTVMHVETPHGLVPLELYQQDNIMEVVRNFCARWGMNDCVNRLYQSIVAKVVPH